MLTMHAVQAHKGDCLLLETRFRNKKRFILIDGGPNKTYDPHLRRVLKSKVVRNGGTLEAICLSHVDDDHVNGLLDLFVELRSADDEDEKPLVKIKELWHNAFEQTVGSGADGAAIATRFQGLMDVHAAAKTKGLKLSSLALSSIRQGHKLAREARLLGLKPNAKRGGKPLVATSRTKPFRVVGLKIRVVGPTRANLTALKKKWLAWLDEQEKNVDTADLTAMKDRSVPNLSSLQLLIEDKDRYGKNRTLLLTGDGRGDHLLDALKTAKLLDAAGGIDLDVLKVPHHGSDRNVDQAFFEKVRARTYVISADGEHGNPDLPTLRWIVDAAKEQNRKITLALTNETSTVRRLRTQRPPAEHGYEIKLRPTNRDSFAITIAR